MCTSSSTSGLSVELITVIHFKYGRFTFNYLYFIFINNKKNQHCVYYSDVSKSSLGE